MRRLEMRQRLDSTGLLKDRLQPGYWYGGTVRIVLLLCFMVLAGCRPDQHPQDSPPSTPSLPLEPVMPSNDSPPSTPSLPLEPVMPSDDSPPSTPLAGRPVRVYRNPYRAVHWETTLRLKAQPHDHTRTDAHRLRAYNAAGYDVVSLMHYNGVASLPFAWQEKRWPPEVWVPPALLDSLRHIKLFVPNGEEVGYQHMTSPFLTTYIAKWEPQEHAQREAWHYTSSQECINLINLYGGMAFLAHPWEGYEHYAHLTGFAGIEIYSAFALFYHRYGTRPFFRETDRNAVMRAIWDQMLLKTPQVLAIAVNDHYGPDYLTIDPVIRDSGKILVLTQTITLEQYKDALKRGAFFAIQDLGVVKDRYPVIERISVGDASMTIDTTGDVVWIANGEVLTIGPTLVYQALPADTRYVRAEVVNAEGSTVYTQAFAIRPVGDRDGDGDVDTQDDAICQAVAQGLDTDPEHQDACH